MNGMPNMDMAAMGMANPLMLQELMMNQMAMMSHIAGAMGIMNPATGQFMNNGFPMQPGMGDMGGFNNGMGQGPVGPGGGGRESRSAGVAYWLSRSNFAAAISVRDRPVAVASVSPAFEMSCP